MASALTTSALIGNYLGSNDYSGAQITAAANAANAGIERYCNRVFAATNYYEWTKPVNGCLVLGHYPVIAIWRVCAGTNNLVQVTNNHPDVRQAQVAVLPGVLSVAVIGTVEASAEIDLYEAGYAGGLVEAINILGSGWSSSLLSDDHELAVSLKPGVKLNAYQRDVYLEGPGEAVSLSNIDMHSGCASVAACGRDSDIFVNYRAGYASIPEDLSQTATEVAVALLQSSGVNRAVASERIGNYSYTSIAAGEMIREQFAGRLAGYRRIAL